MDSTKIWFLADTHFGVRGDDEEWLNDYIGYFDDVVIPLMQKKVNNNDILVHCGDVFDCRSTIGLHTMCRVIELFEKFSNIFKDIRIVVGNHDIFKKSSNGITSINMLKHIPNVKIYYEPCVEVIDGKTCLFNPWIEDLEKEKSVLSGVNVNYIFGHLMIGGSKMSDRSGMKISATSGINVKDFKSAQVYAGHIHIRQDNKNVHYVGNPYSKDRGDRGNKKGITVLDVKTGKTEFIENTYSPKFVKDSIYDIVNLTIKDLKKRWDNNYVDLHLKGCDITRCSFDDLRECLNGVYKSFNPVGDNTVIETENVKSVDFKDAKTSNDYLTEFIDGQDLDDEFKKMVMDKIKEYSSRL